MGGKATREGAFRDQGPGPSAARDGTSRGQGAGPLRPGTAHLCVLGAGRPVSGSASFAFREGDLRGQGVAPWRPGTAASAIRDTLRWPPPPTLPPPRARRAGDPPLRRGRAGLAEQVHPLVARRRLPGRPAAALAAEPIHARRSGGDAELDLARLLAPPEAHGHERRGDLGHHDRGRGAGDLHGEAATEIAELGVAIGEEVRDLGLDDLGVGPPPRGARRSSGMLTLLRSVLVMPCDGARLASKVEPDVPPRRCSAGLERPSYPRESRSVNLKLSLVLRAIEGPLWGYCSPHSRRSRA
jgi:hypothetical protein